MSFIAISIPNYPYYLYDPWKSSILFLATVCDLLYFWFLISLKHKQQIQNKLSFVFKNLTKKTVKIQLLTVLSSIKRTVAYCTPWRFFVTQWYTYLYPVYDLFTTQGTTLLFRLLYIVTNRLKKHLGSQFYLFYY